MNTQNTDRELTDDLTKWDSSDPSQHKIGVWDLKIFTLLVRNSPLVTPCKTSPKLSDILPPNQVSGTLTTCICSFNIIISNLP